MRSMNSNQLLQNRRFQFWSLQLLGWTGWGVTFYLGAVVWGSQPGYAVYVPLISVIGIGLSFLLRLVYRATWDMPAPRRVLIAVLASYLAAAAWMGFRNNVAPRMIDFKDKMPSPEGWDHLFHSLSNVTSAWMVMLCWTGLYFGIKYYQLLQEERERGLKSSAMAHEAQLKMLRYQLNPHFLFNTLNAISTLILDKENQLANTMVTRLSHFLRYSLDNDPMQKVSLAQEINALKLYLDIEKVRFDDRLRLEFDIEPGAEAALIPSLLLQPLVENAIKYAVAQSVNGGSIRIGARVFAGELLLEVTDDGPGIEHTGTNGSRAGVGLANTRERLRELYGANQSFRLGQTDPHGLTVYIRLPLETE
jgi:two-component sensor histidine kinase